MTQEVLKMALEALETELSIDWTNNDEFNASAEKMYEAIAAIKEALAKEKTLQALHDENERLGLYKDAYAQPEQEPPKYSFKAYWEIDGRIGVVACIERPDGGVHLMSEILDLPSSTEPQYTSEHQARIAAFKDAISTTKEKNT
jgi:hypothetical protein